MSNEAIEVRKLPKKTIYLIVILVILGIIATLAMSFSKQDRMAKILSTLGHPNVDSITIYNQSSVKDKDTGEPGELTKLRFYDLDKNQECFGFVLKNKKQGTFDKDLDCK